MVGRWDFLSIFDRFPTNVRLTLIYFGADAELLSYPDSYHRVYWVSPRQRRSVLHLI